MERGPPAESRATIPRRVVSPSAAKTDAASSPGRGRALAADILSEVVRLLHPAIVVRPVGFGTSRDRDLVEARLDDRHTGAARGVLEAELDERRGLFGIVDLGVDGIRTPAIREQTLGLDPLDHDLERDALVARARDPAADGRALAEVALELGLEPGAELPGVGDGPPDACPRRAQQDLLLDPISARRHPDTQPPGCLFNVRPGNATPRLRDGARAQRAGSGVVPSVGGVCLTTATSSAQSPRSWKAKPTA